MPSETTPRRRATPYDYETALEVLALRKTGLNITGIVLAMEHFRGTQLTHHQVRRICTKAGIRRRYGSLPGITTPGWRQA